LRDELLGAYERELTYLRRLGAEFAGRYPKIAARLALEQDKCDDPHVERLIESVAFLCARVRLKIDDDFPEITDALLSVLYPSFLAPVPSTSIVQFVLDPNQASLQVGKTLPRGSMLASRPSTARPAASDGLPGHCGPSSSRRGSSCPAPRRLGNDAPRAPPLVQDVLEPPAQDLRMKVSEAVTKPLSSLRLFLSGEASSRTRSTSCCSTISSRWSSAPRAPAANQRTLRRRRTSRLSASRATRASFRIPSDASAVTTSSRNFTFPEKFLFLDLVGLIPSPPRSRRRVRRRARLLEGLRRRAGRDPGDVPALLDAHREPLPPAGRAVRITHRTADYRVIPT
jgi:hypothetical protein